MGRRTKILLRDKFPELLKEWDYERNTLSLDKTTYGSGKQAHWICSKGHRWQVRIDTRTNPDKPSICPDCRKRPRLSPTHNFAVLYPNLLLEWDYERNIGIDPYNISPKNNKVVHWKCKYGHSWATRITHRANGSNCPKCNNKSSRIEIFIYCEMKAFFPNAINRYKFNGIECDIYLPNEKIAIEFDGRWHKGREIQDANKVAKLRNYGLEVINIRERKQPAVNWLTISYKNLENPLSITKELACLLGMMLGRADLMEYSSGDNMINPNEYYTEIANYPITSHKTLATHNPKLASEWDYEANGNLTPSRVAPFSHHMAHWICPDGHKYEATIANRNNLHQQCPHCQNHSSLTYSRNKTHDRLYPKKT